MLTVFAAVQPVFAQGAKVKAIVISGNKKIQKETILAKISTKVGSRHSSSSLQNDVRALFKMGYFYDVVVSSTPVRGGIRLTYKLVEKPSILKVEFMGNKELKDKKLLEISEIGPYQVLDHAKIQVAVKKIKKNYEDKGYFLAQVQFELIKMNEVGDVNLKFRIVENDKVVVKRIQFSGNKNLTDHFLKSRIMTKEGGFFSFLSGSGSYKQDVFERDLEIIGYLYRNEGYVQAKLRRPQVYMSPDKKGIYIDLRIEEGEKFHVGEINFSGDLLFPEEELRKILRIKSGSIFSVGDIQNSVLGLTAKYGDLGYAYANPIPQTNLNEENKTIDITFDIDKGDKVRVGKINIFGNTKTRDKVIRRELRFQEGEIYNETRRNESLASVRRLGFFEQVDFSTKTPKGRQDVIDFEINVKERNTGQVQMGAGYSSFDGFVLNGQLKELNFLGRGQNISTSVDWSNKRKNVTFNYTEPYFRESGWEVGVQAYLVDRILPNYQEKKLGGGFSLGHFLAPYLKGSFGYKLDATELTLPDGGDAELFPVETANGATSALILRLTYDKRNDRFSPTSGVYGSATLEYAGLGGDLNHTKGGLNLRYYKKLFWEVVWRNNLTFGFIFSNDPGKEVPFNELFLLGGTNTLRGYNFFTVGRRKFSKVAYEAARARGVRGQELENLAQRPFGGQQQFYYNLEFQVPLVREVGVFGVAFYDIGYADNSISFEDLRSNIGAGFRWFSPLGPLRFEWGFPFNPQESLQETKGPKFQFSIGTPF